MKKVQIEISLPSLEIDEYGLREAVKSQVRSFLEVETKYSRLIQDVIKSVVIEEIQNNKKEIKNKVKMFIQTMDSSNLYYRDEFRAELIKSVERQANLVDKRVNESLQSMDYGKIIDAIGYRMADDFYKFIRTQGY